MQNINISVIIPTYNRKFFLKQSVASAVHQSYRNIEIIIVHDGNQIEPDFPESLRGIPIRTFHMQNHSGGSACRNFGISKARYDWIAFLDDDDIWASSKLEEQVKAIINYPELDFVYNDYYIFDSRYRVYDHKYLSRYFSSDRDIFIKNLIIQPVTGSTSSFLIKKTALEKVNGFDETLPSAQDNDLSLRLFKAGASFYCVSKPLLFYRSHNDNVSLNLKNKVEGRKKILLKKRELFPELYTLYRREIKHFHYYALTFSYLLDKNGREAMKNSLNVFKLKKNYYTLLRFLVLIFLSKTNILPIIMNVITVSKQLKYYKIAKEFRARIEMLSVRTNEL